MSYEMCLEKAGAKVLAFQEFGSYQGEWYALVEYKGDRGWIEGSYGSCSGCDAFESEFGYHDGTDEQYAEFGRSYLETILPQDIQMANLQRLIDQDNWAKYEYQQILDFVKAQENV